MQSLMNGLSVGPFGAGSYDDCVCGAVEERSTRAIHIVLIIGVQQS